MTYMHSEVPASVSAATSSAGRARGRSFAVLDAYAPAAATSSTPPTPTRAGRRAPGGESEAIIGRWLAARGNRDDVVIATKVGQVPGVRAPVTRPSTPPCADWRPTTSTCYYAHFDDETVPLEETLGALDELVKAGKVRTIGASNFSAARLAESLAFSDREGWARTSPSSPTTTWSSATPTRAGCRSSPPRGLACIPYFALAAGSSPASTGRAGGRDEARRIRLDRGLGRPLAPSSRPSTRWPPSTVRPWRRSPLPGCSLQPTVRHRSRARARSPSCVNCSR